MLLIKLKPIEHQRIARPLAVEPHPGKGPPKERIEPMERLQKGDDLPDPDISAFQMGRLMKKYVTQLIRTNQLRQPFGQQHRWADESEQ